LAVKGTARFARRTKLGPLTDPLIAAGLAGLQATLFRRNQVLRLPLELAFRDKAMLKNDELRYGAPGETAVHLCVDMQRMFAEGTDWKMPWLERVLPNILSITSTHPEKTIFTRFIPARKPGQGVGMWRHYYERWGSMTIDQLLVEVIITGGETDVCVLATMLGAIDWGFRVILVTDALCSSADETHDAMMNVYLNRFGEQAETVKTQTLLDSWPGRARARRAS